MTNRPTPSTDGAPALKQERPHWATADGHNTDFRSETVTTPATGDGLVGYFNGETFEVGSISTYAYQPTLTEPAEITVASYSANQDHAHTCMSLTPAEAARLGQRLLDLAGLLQDGTDYQLTADEAVAAVSHDLPDRYTLTDLQRDRLLPPFDWRATVSAAEVRGYVSARRVIAATEQDAR